MSTAVDFPQNVFIYYTLNTQHVIETGKSHWSLTFKECMVSFLCRQQSFGLAQLDEIKPGLAAEAVEVGQQVEVIHLTRPSGETIAKFDMMPIAKAVGYPFIGIARHALQRVLRRHLADGDIVLGSRLEELDTHEAEGITELKFEGRKDVVRAKAVVGADGRRYDSSCKQEWWFMRIAHREGYTLLLTSDGVAHFKIRYY